MRDLIVITPSRGRPERLGEMLASAIGHARADVLFAVATDDDDPQARAYASVLGPYRDAGWVRHVTGERRTLSGWTNALAALCAGQAGAFASLGDDHVPRTAGWDRLLLDAVSAMGGTGIAYGDDTIMGQRLPTAPVISADIVEALGWMCLPSLRHMYVDNVWLTLGTEAECLAYVPEVVVEHVHWSAGKTAPDAVYAQAEAGKEADRVAYEAWRTTRADQDAAAIRVLREKARQ